MSPQHRNKDTGDKEKAVFEGQVFLTEEELEEYKVENLEIKIKYVFLPKFHQMFWVLNQIILYIYFVQYILYLIYNMFHK